MEQKLNIKKIEDSLKKKGLNQAALASQIGVSREIVSKWLKNDKFPRPARLLKLGKITGLKFEDIVKPIKDPNAPVVAFRKKGKRKTKDIHHEHAQQMGRLLEELSTYVDDDMLMERTTLRKPELKYSYIQKAASKVRRDLKVEMEKPIEIEILIEKFFDLGVILIPVPWGSDENHGQALHVYLPKTGTAWVYLNLDAKIHDFKYWMSHELAHVLGRELGNSKEAEKFMDRFAQALLFPEVCAQKLYNVLKRKRTTNSILQEIFKTAYYHAISPYTILKSVNDFAEENELKKIHIDKNIFWSKYHKLNNRLKTVTKILTDTNSPSAAEYLKISKEHFKTPFFDLLEKYFADKHSSPGFIQNILDISLLDAKSIQQEL